MKFHKLPHFTRDVTGQHYRPLPSDVSLPRLSERRRRLKFRLQISTNYSLFVSYTPRLIKNYTILLRFWTRSRASFFLKLWPVLLSLQDVSLPEILISISSFISFRRHVCYSRTTQIESYYTTTATTSYTYSTTSCGSWGWSRCGVSR